MERALSLPLKTRIATKLRRRKRKELPGQLGKTISNHVSLKAFRVKSARSVDATRGLPARKQTYQMKKISLTRAAAIWTLHRELPAVSSRTGAQSGTTMTASMSIAKIPPRGGGIRKVHRAQKAPHRSLLRPVRSLLGPQTPATGCQFSCPLSIFIRLQIGRSFSNSWRPTVCRYMKAWRAWRW